MFLKTISVKTWNELKTELLKEFDKKIITADAHNELRNRKKKVVKRGNSIYLSCKKLLQQQILTTLTSYSM